MPEALLCHAKHENGQRDEVIARTGGSMDDRLAALTRANALEILAAFKLDRLGRFRHLALFLAGFPARRLSRHILRFDDLAGRQGLAAAGRYMLHEFSGTTSIEGRWHVPRRGPVLVVANHPGMVDAMAIAVALDCRPDLKIIASERELFQFIPNVSGRLFFVGPRTKSRSGLLREAANHLRQGRALLTFPAGTIEPDPSIRVEDPLAGWSDSAELLVRLVPETVVLPVAVSGVISRHAHEHRIARCFANPKEREWAAATLQVLYRRLRDSQTRLVIGEPIVSGERGGRAAIHEAMASLLARVAKPHDESPTAKADLGTIRCGSAGGTSPKRADPSPAKPHEASPPAQASAAMVAPMARRG
jgi:hypothetical protein